MSLISRLYDVIRSNLHVSNYSRDKHAYDTADLEEEIFGDSESKAFDDDLPPGADPELAKYYANLEVPYGSDLETVKKSWKRLARKYHPDVNADDPKAAEEKFKEVSEAYERLADKEKRAMYGQYANAAVNQGSQGSACTGDGFCRAGRRAVRRGVMSCRQRHPRGRRHWCPACLVSTALPREDEEEGLEVAS